MGWSLCVWLFGETQAKHKSLPWRQKCFQGLTSRMFSSHFNVLLYTGLEKPNLTLLLIDTTLMHNTNKVCSNVELACYLALCFFFFLLFPTNPSWWFYQSKFVYWFLCVRVYVHSNATGVNHSNNAAKRKRWRALHAPSKGGQGQGGERQSNWLSKTSGTSSGQTEKDNVSEAAVLRNKGVYFLSSKTCFLFLFQSWFLWQNLPANKQL